MKRLFAIKDTKHNRLHEGFESKMEAKAHRDKMNGGKFGSDTSVDRFVIVLGPDHWRYQSGAEA